MSLLELLISHAFLITVCTVLTSVSASNININPSTEEDQATLQRHFQSLHSDVYVINNFLPAELALDWRRRMLESWKNTERLLGVESADACPDDSANNSFHFTTNNDGTFRPRGGNAKIRSLSQIPERNATAHKMRQHRTFSYAKWELPPGHDLVKEMEDYFGLPTTREKVTKLLSNKHPHLELQPQLSDLFVTYYGKGDFLFTHNDGASGSWAFVVSLTQQEADWTRDMGGTLRFQCPFTADGIRAEKNSPDYWCEELVPSFNTALIFNTRLPGSIPGPDHEVLPVNVPPESGYFRFGLTGWYMDKSDVMDDRSKAELNKMRSRSA